MILHRVFTCDYSLRLLLQSSEVQLLPLVMSLLLSLMFSMPSFVPIPLLSLYYFRLFCTVRPVVREMLKLYRWGRSSHILRRKITLYSTWVLRTNAMFAPLEIMASSSVLYANWCDREWLFLLVSNLGCCCL